MAERPVTDGGLDEDAPGPDRDLDRGAPSNPTGGHDGWLLPLLTGLLVVVGVVLRFLPRSALWLDEALSANIAGLSLGDIPDALRHDGHPPLYYVLLHFWMSIFGDSDWVVRAMSGVISTLTIPATYLAAKRVAERSDPGTGDPPGDPRRVGLLAVSLVSVFPFAVRYGAETRMYALVMLFATLGHPLVGRMLADPDGPVGPDGSTAHRSGRRRITSIAAATVLTAALLWTHYWSIWLLASVGVVTMWTIWSRRDRSDRRRVLQGPIDLLCGLVVGGVLFVPWLPTMAYQAAHTGTPWGERFGPFATVVTTIVDFSGARFGAAQFLSYIVVVLIVGAAVLWVRTGRTTELVIGSRMPPRVLPELAVIVLTLGLGWTAARISGNTYSARYGAVLFPLFIVTTAVGLALVRRTSMTVVATGVVAALCIYGSFGSARADRTQVGDLVAAIEVDMSEHSIGDRAIVVVCPDQLGVATQRMIDHRPSLRRTLGDVMTFPTSRDPRFVDWVDYAERNAAASPSEFVEEIDTSVDPGTTIYLITSPHYRTLEGKCEGVIDALARGRSPGVLRPLDTSGLDEAAELRVFRPPA